MASPVHLSGLNGFRAIAAMGVMLSHLVKNLSEFGLNSFILGINQDGTPHGLDIGAHGVTIFFVLSGFLITYLLLLEREKKPISIRNFYIRRILRIWPLYYLYLVVALITYALLVNTDHYLNLPFYVFIAGNIPFVLNVPIVPIEHYWSLGVEEQFYAIWPWVVKKSGSLLKVTILVVAALMALKLGARVLEAVSGYSLPYRIFQVNRFHCMLMGAIAAMLYHRKHQLFLSVSLNLFTQIASWTVLFLVTFNSYHIASVIDTEIIALAIVFLIMSQVTKKNKIISLENNVFDFLGKISFGIYVWHPLLLFTLPRLFSTQLEQNFVNYVIVFALYISLTIFISYASYHFFEKPFLVRKNRYAVIESASTASKGSTTG